MCGVIGVAFQHPNWGDAASSGNRPLEGSGITLRRVYFQVELGEINRSATAVVHASDKRQSHKHIGHLRMISFGTTTPCSTNASQIEALAEAPSLSPSLPCSVPLALSPSLSARSSPILAFFHAVLISGNWQVIARRYITTYLLMKCGFF